MKNQEKMKEILEQIRSKKNSNNVAKASVAEVTMENMETITAAQGEKSTTLPRSLPLVQV